MDGLKRALATIIAMLVAVLLFGTLGYMIIERWSALDSLYMAAITLTTVGFGEIHPLSQGGRIFTIVLIFIGFMRQGVVTIFNAEPLHARLTY